MAVLPKYFNSQWSFAKFSVSSPHTICAFASTGAVIGGLCRCCCSPAAVGLDGTWYRFEHGGKEGRDGKDLVETRAFLGLQEEEAADETA